MSAVDGLGKIAPEWLADSELLFPLLAGKDAFVDWVRQGMLARCPTWPEGPGPESALGPIGRDRGIARGIVEGSAEYRARLIKWLETWRLAGHAFGIINALLGYVSGGTSTWCRVVTNSGMWYYGDSTGARTWLASPWDWDGGTAWERYWAILYPGGAMVSAPVLGARPLGSPCIGMDVPANTGETLVQLCEQWAPAHETLVAVIIALDPASFVPGGAGLPAGDWGVDYTVAPPHAPVRLATARYCIAGG